MLLIYYNKRMIMQYATFSKNLNPRNIEKSVSDIRIRFPFDSRFWISVFGCKLTILPDIQPANRMVIISDTQVALRGNFSGMLYKPGKSLKRRGSPLVCTRGAHGLDFDLFGPDSCCFQRDQE